jgi:hypothetical protein
MLNYFCHVAAVKIWAHFDFLTCITGLFMNFELLSILTDYAN